MAAREIDPAATEAEVVERVKSDHPADFEAALEAYRDAMGRARAHLIEHDLVTRPRRRADRRHRDARVPAQRHAVRGVLPAGRTSTPTPKGIYIVTPSVDGDPGAMREHNRASISNTSIHEAYPGHHLQLDVARRPSVADAGSWPTRPSSSRAGGCTAS